MSISAIIILTQRGDSLVTKFYRNDVSNNIGDAFKFHVVLSKENRSPIKSLKTTSFMYIRESDLYIVGVSNSNANVSLVFESLYTIVKICKVYFGGSFDEQSVRDNFVFMYELLDEIIDDGYPQITDVDALKVHITQKGYISEKTKLKESSINQITSHTTGSTPWRRPDIKYKKNQVFLDVIESVNLLISTSGAVLKADVSGKITMKSLLSGMPKCLLGMNDKLQISDVKSPRVRSSSVTLDDVTFHQCVRLGKFETERMISFVPPDGEFELMSYRSTDTINIPFKIQSNIKEISRTRLEAEVMLKSLYKRGLYGTNIKVVIPTPKNTAICKCNVTVGKAKYNSDVGGIQWKIKRLAGGSEVLLRADIELIANVTLKEVAWSRPPVSMQFNVPMFAASGLQIIYLKVVEKSGYDAARWVKYITKAGSYLHRN